MSLYLVWLQHFAEHSIDVGDLPTNQDPVAI